jgi:hypothetical protein
VLVHATPSQAAAMVRAMKCVATGDGADALSVADAMAVEACHHVMLHRTEPLDTPIDERFGPAAPETSR